MTRAVPFGEKTAWCAFKTTDVAAVCRVLFADRKPREVSWDEGLATSYRWPDIGFANVLVTPPLDGYVLATTRGWLGWWKGGDSIARAYGVYDKMAGEIWTRTSEWCGALDCEVQYFASHREYDLYGWGRHRCTEVDEDRELIKLVGDFIQSHGAITPEERALVAALHDSWAHFGFESAEHLRARLAAERDELTQLLATEQLELVDAGPEDIAAIAALSLAITPDHVAARWSIDPNTLDERTDVPATCWLGELYV